MSKLHPLYSLLLTALAAEGALHGAPVLLPAEVQRMLGKGPLGEPPASPEFYARSHSLYTADAEAGYRTAPNLDVQLDGHREFSFHVRTDARGRRGPFVTAPVDVAALGDSFTFGYGVDEAAAWPVRLAGLTGLHVANLGVNGYGPQSELALLHAEALPLRPRRILWQFFTNDFDDAALFARWRQSGHPNLYGWLQGKPDPAAPPLPAAAHSLRGWLHRHSRLYELIKYALRRGNYAATGAPAVVRVGHTRQLLDLSRVQRWSDFNRAEIRAGWELTQAALLAAQAATTTAGAEFAVVLAPSKEETLWSRLPRGEQGRLPDPRGNARRVAEFCAAQGIACLDLGPAFVAAAEAGARLYFDGDLHWNAAGHALAAQQIAQWLLKET